MREVELLVVGAGPAGLSAAVEAARHRVEVLVVDENRAPGGQLFKQIHKFFGSAEHRAGVRGITIGSQLLEETARAGVEVVLDTVAWGIFDGHMVALYGDGRSHQVRAERIVLATGAMENTLAFPGWTLPGVVGAGAAQTLINLHRVLPGRRGLMVGSGNVGLIVGYQILQAGAELSCVVEAAPAIGGYAIHASKLVRTGVPIRTSTTIKEARGRDRVEGAILVGLDEEWRPLEGTEEHVDVDFICVAVGLTPLAELAMLAGCQFAYCPELGGHVPLYDDDMESTVPGIYLAGDVAGIDEAHAAMEEGKLAGLAVAESLGRLPPAEAAQQKGEVRARLRALRAGPFGEGVRRGVEWVVGEKEKVGGH